MLDRYLQSNFICPLHAGVKRHINETRKHSQSVPCTQGFYLTQRGAEKNSATSTQLCTGTA